MRTATRSLTERSCIAYGVSIDVDDGVRAQDELRLARGSLARQSQAASLAELSASIAHEVNQPLAAVVANSDAAQRWLAVDPPNVGRAQKGGGTSPGMRMLRMSSAVSGAVSKQSIRGARRGDPPVISEAADLLARRLRGGASASSWTSMAGCRW